MGTEIEAAVIAKVKLGKLPLEDVPPLLSLFAEKIVSNVGNVTAPGALDYKKVWYLQTAINLF